MAASRTRPGNPDRGWNDPPMFNFNAGVGQPSSSGSSRRQLNKRVAFPSTSLPQPGHAVLNPSEGPPILNPVLSGTIGNTPPPPMQTPPMPIGLRDTPLGNQSAPISPVRLLPPMADSSAPHAVPLVVPGLMPQQPMVQGKQPGEGPVSGVVEERMEDLMSRLSLGGDMELLQHNVTSLDAVLDRYRPVLTMKVCDEIKKKLQVFQECWEKGSLSDIVKIYVTQLSEALVNEENDRANHLHLALMVDHISEVNQWMMGVKRLLHQQQLAIKERQLLSQCREESSEESAGPAHSADVSSHGQLSDADKGDKCNENCDKADSTADDTNKDNTSELNLDKCDKVNQVQNEDSEDKIKNTFTEIDVREDTSAVDESSKATSS